MRSTVIARVLALVRAIRDGDSATVEAAVLRLSRSRRWLAPLALAVGAFTMLFEGLRLVCTNLRLMLIQILPAMWIWLALFDLKLHALHGKSFHIITGPVLIPVILVIAAITAGCYFLNAVFAFAIAAPGQPEIRQGFDEAKRHRRIVLAAGFVVGVLLGFSTIVVTRWGHPWFALSPRDHRRRDDGQLRLAARAADRRQASRLAGGTSSSRALSAARLERSSPPRATPSVASGS